jgi:transcriptional regulator with XRE-family HTH domain
MSFVTQYAFPTSLPWTEKLVSKLGEPEYRHAYMVDGVKTWIARQVRTLREQRDWSQEELGRKTGKPQSAISRVEDPDYGKLTLQTLFDLARAYDLPVLVQFVEWSDWLSRTNDSSAEALQKESFKAAVLADVGAGQVIIEPKYEIGSDLSDPTRTWVGHVYSRWDTNINTGLSALLGTSAITGTSVLTSAKTAGTYVAYGEPRRYEWPTFDEDDSEDDLVDELELEDLVRAAAMHSTEISEIENG